MRGCSRELSAGAEKALEIPALGEPAPYARMSNALDDLWGAPISASRSRGHRPGTIPSGSAVTASFTG